MMASLCDIIFIYDHIYYTAQCALKVSNYFEVAHCCACLSELPRTEFECSIIPTMEQLEVPSVEQGERFC